jgi:uncharacterized pyridoxamine 5'-phosphate oxidase family protein
MDLTDAVLAEYLTKLDEVKDIVLSTCAGNRVTSRMVSCIFLGEEVFFMSWGHHTKCKQIKENPNVALCHNNLQLRGHAEIIGSPLDTANKVVADKFREKQPQLFDYFSKLPGMLLIRVALSSITSWTRDSQGYCIVHIDLEKRDIERIPPTEEYDW